jgi:methylmalonyl-CoA mutase, N-terminal domain
MRDAALPETLKVGEEVERDQLARLRGTKALRDAGALSGALGALERAARAGDNLIPPILAAVRGYATVGEICGALIPVFGTYHEVPVL